MVDIYNSDCLTVLNNIKTNSIDCLITDPPYKIVEGGKTITKSSCSGMLRPAKHDDKTDIGLDNGKLFKHCDIEFKEWLPEIYRVLKDGTDAYIMTNARNLKQLWIEAEKIGFKFHNILVWEKDTNTPNRWYMQSLEFILYLFKPPAKIIKNPGTKNIFKIRSVKNRKHPTQKPIELMKIMIENSTSENDTVIDPFMGSGSTGVACKHLNRNFIGIELDEKYFKIAEKRIDSIVKLEW